MQHLAGARSYKRIAGYFTSSLFEVAGEALEHIPEVKIVCNVDIHPDDLKVAQLRESKMLGRWNERALEAEALLNRERYRRLDAFLAKHGQAVRIAPDDIKKKGELVVGVLGTDEPLSFIDPKTRELVGYDVDLGRAVAQKLTIDFAKKLSATVDALGQECNCVIVNKAALLGGVTIDYTDQVRARMK